MKKRILLVLAAGILTAAAAGCSFVPEKKTDFAEKAEELDSTLSKAEQIDIYDGKGNLCRTLTAGEELNGFFDALDLGEWEWTDAPEERTDVEAVFAFAQEPTETVFGGKPDPGEREEVVRLTIYEGSDIAELHVLAFTFTVKLPEETLEYFRTAAAPPEGS